MQTYVYETWASAALHTALAETYAEYHDGHDCSPVFGLFNAGQFVLDVVKLPQKTSPQAARQLPARQVPVAFTEPFTLSLYEVGAAPIQTLPLFGWMTTVGFEYDVPT